MAPPVERRQSERRALDLPALVVLLDHRDCCRVRARTENISRHGLALRTASAAVVGERLAVALRVGKVRKLLHCEVRYCSHLPGRGFLVGLAFLGAVDASAGGNKIPRAWLKR